MRMMHESRLWVVHLMIKVLRIRLLEVLVVHLRHRVEETVVIVVVDQPPRPKEAFAQTTTTDGSSTPPYLCFLLVWGLPRKNKATFESVEAERQRGI